MTGGNLAYEGDPPFTVNSAGLRTAFVFDPQTEQWSRQPDMEQGRWYPSQVLLPDGRTAILGGYTGDPPGGIFNDDLEVYTPAAAPAAGTIARRGDRQVENYPHLKVLPDGNVLLAGPGVNDSAVLHPGGFTWSDLPDHDRFRQGSTTVFRAPTAEGSTTVTQLGGFDPDTASGPLNASDAFNSTETMDLSDPAPQWTPDAPLNVGRSYANTVALPDGTLLEVGGANGYDDVYDFWRVDPAARQVELLEPGGSAWKLGPASVEDRGYHSTAVLLPDGRVWTAGDDRFPGADWSPTDTAEIYSPPYLYRGPRPELTSVPETLRWGDELGVQTSGASRAVLVAPAATTHGNDMNQRLVPLELSGTVAGKGLNLRAPASANLALPGYYMLFALSPEGVPSMARWVQLRADAPDRPSLEPDPPSSGAGPGAQPPAGGPAQGQSPADGLKRCASRITLGGNGTVRLCDATNPPTASTSQTLTGTPPPRQAAAARRKRRKRTTSVMGSGRSTIPAGQTRPVTAKLTAKARRALRRSGALRLRVVIEARGADGQTATVRRKVAITSARKKRKP